MQEIVGFGVFVLVFFVYCMGGKYWLSLYLIVQVKFT